MHLQHHANSWRNVGDVLFWRQNGAIMVETCGDRCETPDEAMASTGHVGCPRLPLIKAWGDRTFKRTWRSNLWHSKLCFGTFEVNKKRLNWVCHLLWWKVRHTYHEPWGKKLKLNKRGELQGKLQNCICLWSVTFLLYSRLRTPITFLGMIEQPRKTT